MDEGTAGIPARALLQAAFLSHESPVLVVGWKSRRILAASECVERVFGYRPEELQGTTTERLHVSRDSYLRFGEMTQAALASRQDTFHGYYRMARRDGSTFETENLLNIVREPDGTPVASVSVVRDLSGQDALAVPITGLGHGFNALSENLPGIVVQRVQRPDGSIFHSGLQGDLARRLGYSPDDDAWSAETLFERLHPDDRTRLQHAMDRSAASLSPVDTELRVYSRGNALRWLRGICHPRRLDDGSIAWDILLLDVTAQKDAEQGLLRLTRYDPLTGLPNTASFDERLDEAVADARRANEPLVVAAMDIERFHTINESLGFHRGDQALRQVGERLRRFAHGNDVVARYQGDEFLVLLRSAHPGEGAVSRAQQLLTLFDEPLALDGEARYLLRPRYGFSVFPQDGETADALRRSADLALQRARRSGDTGYAFYSAEMTREVLGAMALERALREAIRKREIVPYYQTQFGAAGGEIVGVEVLARWIAKDGTQVPPGSSSPWPRRRGRFRRWESSSWSRSSRISPRGVRRDAGCRRWPSTSRPTRSAARAFSTGYSTGPRTTVSA